LSCAILAWLEAQLPRSWDEIAPGHLVIAQESLDYGWWEAIVLDRKDDMLTLRFCDYPRPATPRCRTIQVCPKD
jgi:hypothetical protein